MALCNKAYASCVNLALLCVMFSPVGRHTIKKTNNICYQACKTRAPLPAPLSTPNCRWSKARHNATKHSSSRGTTPETIWNSFRIEWTNYHAEISMAIRLLHSGWDEFQFVSGVDGPLIEHKTSWYINTHHFSDLGDSGGDDDLLSGAHIQAQLPLQNRISVIALNGNHSYGFQWQQSSFFFCFWFPRSVCVCVFYISSWCSPWVFSNGSDNVSDSRSVPDPEASDGRLRLAWSVCCTMYPENNKGFFTVFTNTEKSSNLGHDI